MGKKKRAFITGVTGQDGSYLAEFLLQKDMKFMVLNVGPRYLIPHGLTTFMKTLMWTMQASCFITAT